MALGSSGSTPLKDATPGRPSIGSLVSTLSEKTAQLVRDEIRLAKAELSTKSKEAAKEAGAGAGLLGAAAFLGFFGFAALLTAAILGLSHVVPAWLAALIVAVVLLIVAAGLAAVGIKALKRVKPPVPERTQASVKRDVDAVKEGLR